MIGKIELDDHRNNLAICKVMYSSWMNELSLPPLIVNGEIFDGYGLSSYLDSNGD